ncbi:MAG: MFS transporter [Bacillaceae bacterium]|nr:MFS transporter [Bacillaceae bacterium]
MGGVGAIIALFVLSPLFDLDRIFPFVIGGCILFVAFILLYLVIDRNPPFTENTAADQEETQALKTLKDGIKNLFLKENRAKLFIFYAIFLYFIGYTGVEALFSIWATEQLGLTGGEAGVTLGFFSLSFVLFAIPAGLLGTLFGKKPLMLIGLIFLPLLFAVIPFLEGLLFIRVVLFLAGIAWACINVQAYALVSDLGGTSKIGLYTGLYYLFSMSSAIIAPFLLGTMMDLFGRDSLFFTAAITMIIAFLFLRAGKVQSTHAVNDSTKSM